LEAIDMKYSLSLAFVAVLTALASTSLAAYPPPVPGTFLYGPATAGYTYLANVYPREWRLAKLNTPHTYRFQWPGRLVRTFDTLTPQNSSPHYYHGPRRAW
jgi:hypothetical protein